MNNNTWETNYSFIFNHNFLLKSENQIKMLCKHHSRYTKSGMTPSQTPSVKATLKEN